MSRETEKANKILLIVGIVAVSIILVLIGIILMMMHARNTAETDTPAEKRPVVVLPENAEEVAEQILKQEDTGDVPLQYQVTMNSTWEFEDGQSESDNAYVANSKDNETAVYFDVIRNDTQETIYQSPVIPAGQDIRNIRLDQDLDEGEYECTLTYHLIDDEQNTLTTVSMWVLIQINH